MVQIMIGQRFNSLTVTESRDRNKHGHRLWLCVCDCGGLKVTKTGDLTAGRVKSCGCLRHVSGDKHPKWKEGKKKHTCVYCGRIFEKYESLTKNYKFSYCGNECRGKHRSGRISGNNNPRFKEKVQVACGFCGKEFDISPCQATTYQKHFCKGTSCFSSWKVENVKGKSNPNYRGGTPEMRKIRSRVSAAMRKAIRQEKGGRTWESLVEYSMADLIDRLKETIPQGYLWERDFISGKGILHIDHIKPMSSFNFNSAEDEDFRNCFSIKNLQLLPAIENMRKSGKYRREEQAIGGEMK
jgi:hypothetical protein